MAPEHIAKELPKFTEEEVLRFLTKIRKGAEGECWKWNGSKSKYGYGRFSFRLEMILAHRISYFLFKGKIGKSLVLHKCDNPECTNPDHLFLGTHDDNMKDSKNKGRNAKGARHGLYLNPEARARGERLSARIREGCQRGETHCNSKLTESQVIEMRRIHFEEGVSFRKLASLFKVHAMTAHAIVTRKRWSHVK
jgi:hypothetical protein